jgi:hypothetical protein
MVHEQRMVIGCGDRPSKDMTPLSVNIFRVKEKG